MAWISVHDHVIGCKLRELSKEICCSQKEALGILISLWLWGINNADKSGELKSAEKEDVADALSTGLSDGLRPIKIVDSLIKTNWIDEVEGSLFLHDWDQWQEQWYKFLSQKEYDAKRKREARKKAKEEQQEDENKKPYIQEDIPKDVPEDGPKKEPKKKDGPKKKDEPVKVNYAKFVKMTEEEYRTLVDDHGQAFTDKCVEVLSNYKGANGKTYKNDYLAILNWVVDKVKKEHPLLIMRKETSGNPFESYK